MLRKELEVYANKVDIVADKSKNAWLNIAAQV